MSSPRKKLHLQRLEFHVVWRRRRRRGSGLLCRHKDTEICSAQLRNWTTFLVPKTTLKPQFKERKAVRPYFSKTSEKKFIPKSFKSLSLCVKTSSRTICFRKFFQGRLQNPLTLYKPRNRLQLQKSSCSCSSWSNQIRNLAPFLTSERENTADFQTSWKAWTSSLDPPPPPPPPPSRRCYSMA